MRVIVLLGAPGAGKGTAAEKLRDTTPFHHVSTGDMLRNAVKKGTAVGQEAEGYMKRGELVPDAVMVRLVEERLDSGKNEDAFMLDGFPRTAAQASRLDESLTRRGTRVERVFLLETPRAVLVARLAGRRVCRACGATYHVVNIPPKRDGVCDACGGELYQRPDDSEATVANRLDVYERQTKSLTDYYRQRGVLSSVDSNRGVNALVADIRAVLDAGAASV